MRVKANFMSDLKKQVEKELQLYHEEQGEKLARQIQADAIKNLNRTLKYRGETKEDGFKGAKTSALFILKKRNGVSISFRIVMIDGRTRQPHKIWHIINYGRPTIQVAKLTRFRYRLYARTRDDSLDAEMFYKYGDWVTKNYGDIIGSVEGRFFYKQLMEILETDYLNKTDIGITVTRKEVN